jgi:hypothetical protein
MSMRKIREVLRLTHELGLSVRQVRDEASEAEPRFLQWRGWSCAAFVTAFDDLNLTRSVARAGLFSSP